MFRKRLAVAAVATAVFVFMLSGCFKNPTDPFTGTGGGGSATLLTNTTDTHTTEISALASQATAQGIYVSVVDQDGNPLNPAYFNGANFQINYLGQTIQGGTITVSTASSAGQSISTALTMDYSGSMSSQSIIDMESAANTFVNNMQAADRGEIIKFDDTILLIQGFTADKAALHTAINLNPSLGGSTALFDSIYMGVTHTAHESGQRAVVAFTDGGENSSTHYPYSAKQQLINDVRATGVPVYAVGLGLYPGSSDEINLQDIANQTGGRYYYAPTSSQLGQIYQQIAQIFNNTMIITWPTFTYQSGATVQLTITYMCATGTYTTTANITLP